MQSVFGTYVPQQQEPYFIRIEKVVSSSGNETASYGFLCAGIHPEILVSVQEVPGTIPTQYETLYNFDFTQIPSNVVILKISNKDYEEFMMCKGAGSLAGDEFWELKKPYPTANNLSPVSLFTSVLQKKKEELIPTPPQTLPLSPQEQHALKEAVELLALEALQRP